MDTRNNNAQKEHVIADNAAILPETRLQIRTGLKGGQYGANRPSNDIGDKYDSAYTSTGVSGNHPMSFENEP